MPVPMLISIDRLRPGLVLAEPVMQRGQVLVGPGHTITERSKVVIEDRHPFQQIRVGVPGIDARCDFEVDDDERHIARGITDNLSGWLIKNRQAIAANGAVDQRMFDDLGDVVGEAISTVKAERLTLLVPESRTIGPNYPAEHAAQVTLLSIILARQLTSYVMNERERLCAALNLSLRNLKNTDALARATMCLDVSLLKHKGLFTPGHKLSSVDREAISRHPIASAEMLPRLASPLTKAVIKSHHENMSGDGYPKGASGSRLHVFSRLARVADSFDAATTVWPKRRNKSAVRAIWELMHGPRARRYDATLVKMMLQVVQPLPIGARVQLEDGRLALICGYNRDYSLSPLLFVGFDARGRVLSPDAMEGPFELQSRPDICLKSRHGESLRFMHDASQPSLPPVNTLIGALYQEEQVA